MIKAFIFVCMLSLNLFGSWFDDRVDEYKRWFLTKTSNQVVEYLKEHFKKEQSKIHKYFTKGFNYNYGYDKDTFYMNIYMPEYINIKNHKKMRKFIDDTKNDIKKFLCNDYVFKASLHTNIKLKFEIQDTSNNSRVETIYYNKNSVLACSLL